MLATGHFTGTDIHIWNLKTNKLVKKLKGPAFRVYSLAFSPDGTRLVSGGGNYSEAVAGELFVWETASWKTIHAIPRTEQMIYDVAVSPDNKRIATASQDHSVRTWDMATRQRGTRPPDACGSSRHGCFHEGRQTPVFRRVRWPAPVVGPRSRQGDRRPIGQCVGRPTHSTFTGRKDLWPRLEYWDRSRARGTVGTLSTIRSLTSFPNHVGLVSDVGFSPDGKTLVSVGGIPNPGPWLASSGLRWEAGPRGPWYVSVTTQSPPGKSTTTLRPSSEIHFWDLETKTALADLPGPRQFIESAQFTPDGMHLITVGGSGMEPGEIHLFDVRGIRPKAVLPATAGLTCGKFNPDGSLFATGGMDGSLILWRRRQGGARPGDSGTQGNPPQHAWSPDGTRLFTSGEDGTVRSWNPKTGEPGIAITAADRAVYGLAISPDGTMSPPRQATGKIASPDNCASGMPPREPNSFACQIPMAPPGAWPLRPTAT